MQQIVQAGLNTTAALIKINNLNLLLPQGEIRTLESSSDVDRAAPALQSVGWVGYMQKHWPVYCLTEQLVLMSAIPPERRACAILTMGAGYIGILCDDMTVIKNFTAKRYELPVAMKLNNTPVLYLAEYEQGVACVCNASKLTAYIERLVLNA
jgi:hypothetical protein